MRSVFRSVLVNDFISKSDNKLYREKELVRASCALQNKIGPLRPQIYLVEDYLLLQHKIFIVISTGS